MQTDLTRRRNPWFGSLIVLGAAAAIAVGAVQDANEQEFIREAARRHQVLNTARIKFQEKVEAMETRLNKLIATYEEIVLMGRGPQRRGLIELYSADLTVVFSDRLNLVADAGRLQGMIDSDVRFLSMNNRYIRLDAYDPLNKLVLDASLTVPRARSLPIPTAVPLVLPDAPTKASEVVDLRYKTQPPVVNVPNQLLVDVRSNYRQSKQRLTVEVGIIEGKADFKSVTSQSVILNPGETRALTWDFTRTDKGPNLRMGARIVK